MCNDICNYLLPSKGWVDGEYAPIFQNEFQKKALERRSEEQIPRVDGWNEKSQAVAADDMLLEQSSLLRDNIPGSDMATPNRKLKPNSKSRGGQKAPTRTKHNRPRDAIDEQVMILLLLVVMLNM